VLAPIAGPSYPSEPLVTIAAVLACAWLLGVVGVFDAGRFVHLLLGGALVIAAVIAFTRAR
jgi:hypothetical protein